MNKLDDSSVSGFQTFYKNQDEISKNLANNIQNNLNIFIKNENSKKTKSISDIYLTENVKIPLVLIECGFLSNSEENQLLQSDSYQDKISWSIYTGIMDYFEK